MQIRRVLKLGGAALVVLGGGYLLGSGTIGDVLNIGESKIGAGSTRADNEEYRAETERLEAEAARARARAEQEQAALEEQLARERRGAMTGDIYTTPGGQRGGGE